MFEFTSPVRTVSEYWTGQDATLATVLPSILRGRET